MAYTAPHWPMHALAEDIAKYRGATTQGWDALREERYRRMVENGPRPIPSGGSPPGTRGSRPGTTAEHKEWEARRMEVYAAMVDRMDQGIGRHRRRRWRRTGRSTNTLILFLADNGGCAEELTRATREWVRHITARARPATGRDRSQPGQRPRR